MGKLFFKIIVILILTVPLQAQSYEVVVVQDIKLAVMADDWKNKPFTLDLVIKARARKELTHLSISYERAELQTPYNRLVIGFGVNYTHKKIDFVQSLSYGVIFRNGDAWGSYGIDSELSYFVTDKMKIVSMLGVTQRSEWDIISVGVYLGLGYKIN